MKTITTILKTLLILLVILVIGLFSVSYLHVPGSVEIKIVKSGSMEPSIKTGSLVVIKPSSDYAVGDVITFGSVTKDSVPTTHRIVSISKEGGSLSYEVKGDANEEADSNQVLTSEVIGKVIFTIPYAGFLVDFARQPLGFILLIAIPAALVILNEVIDLTKEVRKILRRRKEKAERSSHLFMAYIIVILGTGLLLTNPGSTVSYFSDAENSLGNSFSAMSFSISATASPEESYVGETGGSTIVSSVATNPTGLPHEYKITVEKIDGSDAFCQSLDMNSTTTPPFVYLGPLLNFVTPPTTFAGDWQFEVTESEDPVGVNPDDKCVVDFVYSASTWLEVEGLSGGYTDVARVTLTFEADEEIHTTIETQGSVEVIESPQEAIVVPEEATTIEPQLIELIESDDSSESERPDDSSDVRPESSVPREPERPSPEAIINESETTSTTEETITPPLQETPIN